MGLLTSLEKKSGSLSIISHRNLYLLGLALILCGLLWANFLMSLGQLVLLGNWLLEANFKAKYAKLSENKNVIIVLLLFLIHLLGCAWTIDFDYAMKDIVNKLPLLVLPILIASTEKLSKKEWKFLLGIYFSTSLIISLISLGKLLGFVGNEIVDKRELSVLISHIRYGLNLAFAVILIFYFSNLFKKRIRYALYFLAAWFILALFKFELSTGLTILIILSFSIAFLRFFSKKTPTTIKVFIPVLALLIGYFILDQFNQVKQDFYSELELNYKQDSLVHFTPNGEIYKYDFDSDLKENGVFVWRFIASNELRKSWNKRSHISFDSLDNKNQKIVYTLTRFLSSKGLKKDSIGMSKLSNQEIKAIENGIPSVYYLNHNLIQNRLYSSFYEFDNYSKGHSIDGFSLAMRLEYWNNCWQIIQKNFWFGVGTGDIKDAIAQQYILDQSELAPIYQKRAHNQYLTFWATFGLLGLLIILISLYYPLIRIHQQYKRVFFIFLILVSLSFLTEDTLETQAGVTFFAIFYYLILFALPEKEKLN